MKKRNSGKCVNCLHKHGGDESKVAVTPDLLFRFS